MSENRNIEEIYRSSFEDFEADVPGDVWTNVESSVGEMSTVGNTASTVGKATLVKAVAGTIIASIVALTVGYFLGTNEAEKKQEKEQVSSVANIEENSYYEDTVVLENSGENPPETDADVAQKVYKPREKKNPQSVTAETPEENSSNEAENNTAEQTHTSPYKPVEKGHNFLNSAPGTPYDHAIETYKKEQSDKDKSIVVKRQVVADIVASREKGTAPLKVSFANHGYAGKVEWQFMDNGEVLTSEYPTHVFEEEGEHYVVLRAFNSDGLLVAEDEVMIQVMPKPRLEKPMNVFSPNSDGINDNFVVKGIELTQVQLTVRDVNGMVVYSGQGESLTWDGRDRTGQNVPEGTYFIVVSATGSDGNVLPYKGTLTLVR